MKVIGLALWTHRKPKYLREVGWERSIGNQGNTTEQVEVSTKKCPWLHFESQLLKKIAREISLKKINNKYLLRIYYVSNPSGNTPAVWLSCCSQGAYNLMWETIQTFWSWTGWVRLTTSNRETNFPRPVSHSPTTFNLIGVFPVRNTGEHQYI